MKRTRARQYLWSAIETMESRLFLSAVTHARVKPTNLKSYPISLTHKLHAASTTGSSVPYGLTPAQIRGAYGLGTYGASPITFNGVQGDGTGQTIAIIDAYDDPNAFTDLQGFDSYFGLPDPPSFQKLNQTGSSSSLPGTDPGASSGSSWEQEESLDIEWSHVMAPKANIILYEATNSSNTNLYTAINTADNNGNVSVVSMSFGSNEFSQETNYDTTYFNTPGITYVASTGDSGGELEYPAVSPKVVAVGGTTLTVSGNTYVSESAWDDGGGGVSTKESRPTFQKYTTTGSTTKRTVPDVSLDADPNTGVPIYDSFDYGNSDPWLPGYEGGTSLAAPLFAGIVAVVDQGRVAANPTLGTLTGSTQTLPYLYELPASNFNDITTGSNGHSAVGGYDQATGIGSPVGGLLIYDLAGTGAVTGTLFADNNGNTTFDGTDTALSNKTVYLDLNNNNMQDGNEPTAITSPTGTYSFGAEPAGGTVHLATASLTGYVLVPLANTVSYGASDTINIPVFPTTFSTTVASTNYTLQTDSTGTIEQIQVNGTQAYSVAKSVVSSTALTFSLTGTGDTFTVNGANGNPVPTAGITVTGATGGDVLSIIGTASGNDAFTVTSTSVTFGTSPINFSNISSLLLNPGGGLDSLAVNSGSATVTARSSGSGFLNRNFSSVTVAAAASALFATSTDHTSRMLVQTTTLSVLGKLDLGGNDLIVHGGDLTKISTLIGTGYANGNWNGSGISSSAAAGNTSHLTALGVMQNTLYGGTNQPQFDGVSPVSTDILVKYTYYGDTTLDGKVDGTDYSRIDNGLLTGVTGWTNGDFNFDNHIDGSDYTLIDNDFNSKGSPL